MSRRLIATDMDGTLLRSDETISPRVKAALDAAKAAGWFVVPISGRMPVNLRPVADLAGLDAHAVAGNGAVGFHLQSSGWLFESTMAVEAQMSFALRMRQLVSGLKVAAVRNGGDTFHPERGYTGVMDPGDHGRERSPDSEADLSEVLSKPAVKMVLRRPGVAAEELLALAEELAMPGVHPSISGAPFLEVAAAGVNKASGLARLCELLGVRQQDTVAFGDHFNDMEMIAWAGHGVAMANAVDPAKEAADEVTLTNDEDGVAVIIERLLSS